FSSTDEEGRRYPDLTPDEAFDRIIGAATVAGPTLGTNMLNRISLVKAGKTLTAEQIKEDIIPDSIKAGAVSPRGINDGLIYCEAPAKKKFRVQVSLGGLWSNPFTFATSKPK